MGFVATRSMRGYRLASLCVGATCLLTMPVLAAEPDAPASPEHVVVTGSMVQTDGMLTDRTARKMRHAIAPRQRVRTKPSDTASNASSSSGVWLFDYVARLLDTEPAVAQRKRIVRHAGPARRIAAPVVPASLAATAVPEPAAAPNVISNAPIAEPVAAPVTAPSPAAAPIPTTRIMTGSVVPMVPVAPVKPTAAAPPPDADGGNALISAAERYQIRADLVKLEFAARTYDETKLSGDQVFAQRSDWHVLERAREALSGAEQASAAAVGFEANAYINEITKTIVVAVAGSQDLRRDFFAADVWQALIKSESPQQFYMAKTYVRSVIKRYQMQGFSTECVGHSLGGGACAYAAAELGIRAVVVNPISAGKLAPAARSLVTNYVVDGDIANLIYGARGHELSGNVQVISDGRDAIRLLTQQKYGQLAGPILVVRELRASIDSHKVDHALDLVAAQAEVARPR